MRTYSMFDRPTVEPEINGGDYLVDLALYKPTRKRIDEYLRAGHMLEDTKRVQYHSDMLDNMLSDPDWTDPLLYAGYDRIELEQLHKDAIEDIKERYRLEAVKNQEKNVINNKVNDTLKTDDDTAQKVDINDQKTEE